MASQTERLLARARDRFTVQDYYGAIYLLEEIVASGRAFADVHHLIGVSLSLLGRSEEALTQFRQALELNPRYLEALIHQGLVLSELGRAAESEEAFRRAAESVAPSTAGPAGAGGRARSRTSTPSWPTRTPRRARSPGPSSNTSARSSSARASRICATAWRG